MTAQEELTQIIIDLARISYRADKMDVSNTEHALDSIIERLEAVQRKVVASLPLDTWATLAALDEKLG